MDSVRFEEYLKKWSVILPKINVPLKAFGEQEVDISAPGWLERLSNMPTPLDEDKSLGLEFNSVADEIVEIYLQSTVEQCRKIRELLSRYEAVLHFLGIPSTRIKTENDVDLFRSALAMLSIENQGRDARDTIVALVELCKAAKQAGIDTSPHLKEIAALSSDADKYGMGSMRDLFLQRAT